jgi:hypothetical protein
MIRLTPQVNSWMNFLAMVLFSRVCKSLRNGMVCMREFKERSFLEEVTSFERQVVKRMAFIKASGGRITSTKEAEADLVGLDAHNEPPRLLSSEDFREGGT